MKHVMQFSPEGNKKIFRSIINEAALGNLV